YGLDGFDEPRRQSLRGLLGMPWDAGPWDAGWKACATPIMLVLTISMLDGAAPKRTVLFMCPYGGAKSVIAMSYFNRLAERDGIPFGGAPVAAGTPSRAQ